MGKRAFKKLFAYGSELGRGLGGALGVNGGWLPLPTRPQRYCDPASLVSVYLTVHYFFFRVNNIDFEGTQEYQVDGEKLIKYKRRS